ncbi:MAG: helix-turn-helix domain-containing protein [Sedimenticola sp.]
MIWSSIGIAIGRIATAISVTYSIKKLGDDIHKERYEIKPHRIYSSQEVAKLLGMKRHEVLLLISAGTLQGRLVSGNYRVSGQCILEYLKNEA